MSDKTGTKHSHNWKGGRTIASNGYVLIYVGKSHHLADVRGYAYEHRLVAEQKLGRRLVKGEIPHHLNGIKTDNRPDNIEVVESGFAHRVRHRTKDSGRQLPHQTNELVSCACGCGEIFAKYDAGGRPRRFVAGHNTNQPAPTQAAILAALQAGTHSRAQLLASVKATGHAISMALQHLQRKGCVRQLSRGQWERVS